jgi:hypothetical protein
MADATGADRRESRKLSDRELAVMVDVQAVELGFHEPHELLS